ncbi:MAG: FHA domain-containing protein, partial [Gammaproteobacteria bacterium]
GRPDNADYDERLLAFYSTLDPYEDAHFVRELRVVFQTNKQRALAKAQGAFEQAQALWGQYRSDGGIGGKLRLESKASPQFKKQARLLSDASQFAASVHQVYELLDASAPRAWQQLGEEIRSELERQRRSLNDLDRVLGQKVVRAKLELLASPVENGS